MDTKQNAEKHWLFISGLLQVSGIKPTEREHYLFVEAFLHGAKHAEEELKNNGKETK